MNNILITGINGFIGQNLAKHLYNLGNAIYGIGRQNSTKLTFLKDYFPIEMSEIKNIEQNLRNIDCIYHLATETQHDAIEKTFSKTLKDNSIALTHLLDLSKKIDIQKLIFASSGKVYGVDLNRGYSENDYPQPNTKLGMLKKNQESILMEYSKRNNTQVIIARIFNVFGPFQKNTFIIPTILSQLVNSFVKLGNLNFSRDYLFISDVVSALALLKSTKNKNSLEVFNIGSGERTSVRDILNEFELILDREIIVRQVKNKIRVENKCEFSDSSKLRGLDWKQNISLKKGLLTCYKHWGEDKWM